jgi:fermentation-respiration switch protein FrsA (DUF1100 family)
MSGGSAASPAPGPFEPRIRPRRRGRLVALGLVVVALLGATGYTAYAAVVGGDWVVHPDDRSTDCRTPAVQFGWAYEAVNYDPTGDALLRPEPANTNGRPTWTCPEPAAPAGSEVVTGDGVSIAGWYIPAAAAGAGADPGAPTILLAHGRSSNKSEILRYAAPLHESFNLLVIDLRNGGQSGGTETSMGLLERLDVAAALDWLERTKHPTWVAGVGISLGGVALAADAVDDPRLRALVLDSVHARVVTALEIGVSTREGYPAIPTGWAMATGASFRLGVDITAADPIVTLPRLGTRPILFLHGTADPYDVPARSVELNLAAAQAAGVPAEVHYCEGAVHAGVYDRCPAEWGAWVVTFLDAARTAGG